ncbi:histone H3 lysine 36 (K36) methyltransferase [Ophiocordyceps camponoti-floridani]|uniref:Histone-lysine N-methyltransferase, H3 lysine-36 specific n=1 Tax=Ophiocordyceps camponoti-floridani TaxID=2030778 RepID=A0A8H4Q8L0_9HYPO|nr:histone H3 lysine 36 (K36) methyltransferase [Ophiocordyceps camponoti-floridani]
MVNGDIVATNGTCPSPSTSLEGRGDTTSSRSVRKSAHKMAGPEPRLFHHLPDVTARSCESFHVIPDCLYGSKHLGSTDNDVLDCDCREDWRHGSNFACGDDSDCINRATKMECGAGTGSCGDNCQNQRFQRKQWAAVSVIKTEKKGFGLRTDACLLPNDFVFEYIGEVINEPTFRRRMLQYDREGIKHFYFMSLSKSEFVDATKKGNLGRFCNHSCSPNCYVDKWVVGEKLRMGIFALRTIRAGEELVFNYNVDRYGADPQPCYCGEPNCVGFIGGKTQTERATKLPAATVEALGIDDADGWDTAVARKPRKKRPEEDDEQYINSIQARSLDDDGARKVMAALMQCKEKWIAVKLLARIQRCDDDRVIHCVMRMHAYQILKTTLNTFIDDDNVVLQALDILEKLPRLTRNKIQDSNIEATIETLAGSAHGDVASKSRKLLDDWSKLEVAYRIRRRKVDPNAPVQNVYNEDRRGARDEPETTAQSTPKTTTASPRTTDAPKGPRTGGGGGGGGGGVRNGSFYGNYGQRPRPRPQHVPLPDGWFSAKDARGNTYFYTGSGKTTWQRPTLPATESVNKGPSKALQEQLAIQSIIDKVTREGTPKQTAPAARELSEPASRQDKWRSLPLDKQMRIYENTVFPPVKYVLDRFRHKLPKEELKRLGKDIAKKLVASDYKNGRVDNPSVELTEKQVNKIKKYVSDFLSRAVDKYQAHQKRRASREKGQVVDADLNGGGGDGNVKAATEDQMMAPETVTPSDVDADSPGSGLDRKRKREGDEATATATATAADSTDATPSEGPDCKRLKDDEASNAEMTAAQREFRAQEEALERENEEAQRLEDEGRMMEAATKGGLRKDVILAA